MSTRSVRLVALAFSAVAMVACGEETDEVVDLETEDTGQSSDELSTCSLSVSPTTGTTKTVYMANWSSNATTCSWRLNGVNQGAIACSGSSSLTLAAGYNKITLVTPDNSCSAAVTVAVPLPSCSVRLSSTSSPSTYTANWSSNGTSCHWSKDAVYQGTIACSGSSPISFTSGSHYVTLSAVNSGGSTMCASNKVYVP